MSEFEYSEADYSLYCNVLYYFTYKVSIKIADACA